MTEDAAARGRLFLVTAPSREAAARVAMELGRRLPRSFVVAGSQVDSMVVSGRAPDDEDDDAGLEGVKHLLMRWSACLAMAETYQLEGFDAVVHDSVMGGHLEDFLDLSAPEPVHVVVLADPRSSDTPQTPDTRGTRDTRDTPRWGLWLDPTSPPDQLAEEVLARLDEATVLTAEPADEPRWGG
jgi:hypothetical protein